MPVPSYPEITEMLCGLGQPFAFEVVDIRGVPTRAWKHAPRSLAEVLVQGRANGDGRDLIRLDDERLTHDEHYDRVAALATAFVERLGVSVTLHEYEDVVHMWAVIGPEIPESLEAFDEAGSFIRNHLS
jgi:acetyl esterase/lipase